MSIWRHALVLICGGLVLAACDDSRETPVAGGSSTETSNTLMARYVDEEGMPVAGAAVRIRPADWGAGGTADSLLPEGRTRLDTVLDTAGRLRAGSFRPGLYSVEVVQGALTLRRELRTGIEGVVDTLQRSGGVAGRFSPGWRGSVRVVGSDIVIASDDSGRFARPGLAAGLVTLDLEADSAGIRRKARVRTVVPPRATADLGSVPLLVPQEEDPSLWTRRLVRVIDNTSTGITRDVEDFPLWIPLPDSVGNRADVSDLRVRDEDDSARPLEFVPASRRASGLWARMRRVDGSSKEHDLAVLWRNDEAPSWSDPASVFDSAHAWRGVWHFDADLSCATRGCAAFSGIASSDTGLSGSSRRFDGTQTLAAADSGTLEPSDLTVTLWVNIHSLEGTMAKLVWKDSDGQSSLPSWGLFLRKGDTGMQVGFRMRGGPSDSGVFASVATGRWVHLAATADRARGKAELFVDGVSSGTFVIDAEADSTTRGDLRIGSGFVGLMDELRISRISRPQAWFALERVNFLMPGTLLHP